MRFAETALPGVYAIELEPHRDARGFFARMWCEREAQAAGLAGRMVQDSVGHNRHKGILRGLHYHAAGFPQVRVVRCIAGAAFVAAVDLRPDSATHCQHISLTLDAVERRALYIPPGIALGYQTLEDDTDIYYQMTEFYAPEHERGVRWNDPAFGVVWPGGAPLLKERDANYPDYRDAP